MGFGQLPDIGAHGLFELGLLGDDIITELNTFVAYVDGRSSYEFFYLVLAFTAE
jgi:hypothetical protein